MGGKLALIGLLASAGAVSLAASACADDGVSIAGVYSSKHKVNIIGGSKVDIDGYLSIDRDGTITVFGARKSTATGKECYFEAGKNAVDYQLQGRTLTAGTAPTGEPDYEVKIGDDTFGIFAQPDPKTGKFRWFYHRGSDDATATVTGPEHTVNIGNESYSITGPRVASLSLIDLKIAQCD